MNRFASAPLAKGVIKNVGHDRPEMKAAEGSRTPKPSAVRCALKKRASVLECGCLLPLWWHNPFGVGDVMRELTQGSSFLATPLLGWRTQSLWDWKMRARRRRSAGAL